MTVITVIMVAILTDTGHRHKQTNISADKTRPDKTRQNKQTDRLTSRTDPTGKANKADTQHRQTDRNTAETSTTTEASERK